jgi:hypothetical protein
VQLFRKQQVLGSNPSVGSTPSFVDPRVIADGPAGEPDDGRAVGGDTERDDSEEDSASQCEEHGQSEREQCDARELDRNVGGRSFRRLVGLNREARDRASIATSL